jgi:FKBP-type peptidyl-prolyl cis-trans isomerase FkpA/FKBP-type peptidyl-prolyl cis-trans isomerase FklB
LFVLVQSLVGCDSGTPPVTTVAKPAPKTPGPVDADAPEEFTTTASGLKYRIRRKSDGTKPTSTQMVKIDYRGWLDDGTIFDTTYGTGGHPSVFEIPSKEGAGFREGLQLIGEGGMIELEVPAKLAYGEYGLPHIPANSTLHFIVEMIKVSDPPPVPADLVPPSNGITGIEPGPVDADAPDGFTTTASGLKYRVRRKTDGPKPKRTDSVKVHYRGWLDDGKGFDSSYLRKMPTEFPLSGVIPGWTEGLQHVGVGGMIELEVPSKLGYGAQGQPPTIPPDATLHFLVELIEILPP